MKSMVASHRGTSRLTSKLLVLGLCLGFNAGHLRAQDEATPAPAAETAPATQTTPTTEPTSTPAPEAGEKPTTAPAEQTPPPAEAAPVEEKKPEEKKPEEEGVGEKIKKARQKNRKETSEALLKRRGKDPATAKYVMLGEAQTLPEKVLRFRYVRRNVAGNQTFEDGGNKKDIGIDAVVNVNAYVLEYGLTDKFSLQLLIPQLASNQVTINAEKFSKSKIYAKKYNELMEKTVPFLVSTGQCANEEECYDKINNKAFSLPVGSKLMLPTGEVYTVPAQMPLERAAYSLITNAAKPQDGKTGLSDIMIAALYNVYSSKWQMFSIGGGFRLPTGKGDDEKTYNRTGSGFTTLGIGLKYDYRISDPLMLSFSNQTEIHIKNAHYKRHSLVDPDQLNQADPNAVGADVGVPGDGDGVSNDFEVSRKVPLNTGYVRVGYALGDLNPMLSTLSVFGYYNWNFDPEVYYDGEAQANGAKSTGYSYALAFDGLGLNPRIPVAVSISQDRLLTGENVFVAAVNTYLNFTLYYKF